jgi:hypothetical protein
MSLLDTVVSDLNVATALKHKANVQAIASRIRADDLSAADGARLIVEECDAGIGLVRARSAIGSHAVLDVLAELHR